MVIHHRLILKTLVQLCIRLEAMQVQALYSQCFIEPFDNVVLRRFARLYIPEFNPVAISLCLEAVNNKRYLRAIICLLTCFVRNNLTISKRSVILCANIWYEPYCPGHLHDVSGYWSAPLWWWQRTYCQDNDECGISPWRKLQNHHPYCLSWGLYACFMKIDQGKRCQRIRKDDGTGICL